MTRIKRPYGKRERLLRRQAEQRAAALRALAVGCTKARKAISNWYQDKEYRGKHRRQTLGEWVQDLGIGLLAKGICWVIEAKMWAGNTRLDDKMEVGPWVNAMKTGPALCRRACA
jgi:hypothetical protein